MNENHLNYLKENRFDPNDYVVLNPFVTKLAKKKDGSAMCVIEIEEPKWVELIGPGCSVAFKKWCKANGILEAHEAQSNELAPKPPVFAEKVEQVKERISSEKNRKNLERLGAKFLDKADLFKASLCSKISGEHLGEYVADEEMKDILIECIKEYLETKEVTELSPSGALMAALAMWTLPPLGVALLDRFQLKKEEKKAQKKKTSKSLNKATTEMDTIEEIEAEETGEAQRDYTHLKEYQEQRKVFETNAAGKYNRTAKGTYLKVDLADEQPSPEVQELIDAGQKDREIRKILGYG